MCLALKTQLDQLTSCREVISYQVAGLEEDFTAEDTDLLLQAMLQDGAFDTMLAEMGIREETNELWDNLLHTCPERLQDYFGTTLKRFLELFRREQLIAIMTAEHPDIKASETVFRDFQNRRSNRKSAIDAVVNEESYSLALFMLAYNGDVDIQREFLYAGEKWLTPENVQYILDMNRRDRDITEHTAILLAQKWTITKDAITERFLKFLMDFSQATDFYGQQRIFKDFGGRDQVEMIATALGLSFLLIDPSSQEAQKSPIIELLKSSGRHKEIKMLIQNGLKAALNLCEGQAYCRYRWGEKQPYGFTPPTHWRQNFSELNIVWKNLSGEFLKETRGEETSGHRRIARETYFDEEAGKQVPTIFKFGDLGRSQEEAKNLKRLKAMELPVPEFYEVTPDGIRVQDLAPDEDEVLLMDEFSELAAVLAFAENETDLRQELQEYLKILEAHQIDSSRLHRVLGVVLNKITQKGKLFFVDLDHVFLS